MARERYYEERRPSNAPAWAMVVIMVLAVAAFIAFLYPDIAHMPGATPAGNQAPPAAPSGAGASRIIIDRPAVNVEATSAAYNATEQARVPNVNTTNDSAPVVRESIQVQRQPAPAYAPTSEPIPQTQSDGNFGSKPAPAINIQAAHTCLHGQIWTDTGCHNPTPVN